MSLQAEIMSLRTEHAQTVGQLTSQAVAQRSGFREQIRHLQDEHRTTVETLQNQMTRLENQLFTLQKQTSKTGGRVERENRIGLIDGKRREGECWVKEGEWEIEARGKVEQGW
jgi:hypothetical protein